VTKKSEVIFGFSIIHFFLTYLSIMRFVSGGPLFEGASQISMVVRNILVCPAEPLIRRDKQHIAIE